MPVQEQDKVVDKPDNLVADIQVQVDMLVVDKLAVDSVVRDIEVQHFREKFQEHQQFLGEIAVDFLGDFED